MQTTRRRALAIEEQPASSRRAVAALVAGVIAVLLATNAVAAWVLRDYTANIGYALTSQKWELLLARTRPFEWLVLGDSTCNQGVDPEVLEEALGGDVLNLCTVASSLALDSAWMLEVAIERLGAPRHVLVIHSFHVWERGFSEHSLARVPLEWEFWSRLEPRLELDARQLTASFAHRHLPLYAEHLSLARLLREPWKTQRRFAVDARGFMSMAKPNPESVDRDARRHHDFLADRSHFDPSLENRRALEQIGRLADRHEFPVYLANAPVFRGLAETDAFRRHQVLVSAMMEELASRHPNVHFVAREFPFDRDAMQNVDHLVAHAAARYTSELWEALAAVPGARLAGSAVGAP